MVAAAELVGLGTALWQVLWAVLLWAVLGSRLRCAPGKCCSLGNVILQAIVLSG